MSFLLRRIKKTIGRNYDVNLDDVLETKTKLNHIGHYEMPNFGLTPYPDRALFKGIKGFQEKTGLKVDGVMKPDGPTEKELNQTLSKTNDNAAPKPSSSASLGHNLLKMDARPKKSLPHNKPKQTAAMAKSPHQGMTEREPISGSGYGGSAAAIGTAIGAKMLIDQMSRKKTGLSETLPTSPNDNTAKIKMDAAPKLPPLPGLEPPKRKPEDNKEEYPAENVPPAVFDGYKTYEERKAAILSFPIPDDPMFKGVILPAWKGPPELQAYNDKILKALLDGLEARGIKATEKWGGKDEKERHVKNPFNRGKTIKGSRFPDVSVEIEETEEVIDANSQTTYGKSHKPTKGERKQIEDLKKYKKHYGDKGGVLEIPKEKAFESSEKAEEYINGTVESYLTERHGPRRK